ncbi:alpha/beta hydrolase [Gammaproteobacteria bacterium AS21]
MTSLTKKYQVETLYLVTLDHRICYRLYKNLHSSNDRKMVMLHGAGVAGVDTWSNIISLLEHWQYILVPDLRGMGDSYALECFNESLSAEVPTQIDGHNIVANATLKNKFVEPSFDVFDLVADVALMTGQLNWSCFDLAGYSLGGLVAMLYKQKYPLQVDKQFLLEPGLLDRVSWLETKALRAQYAQTVEHLRSNHAEQGIIHFLTTISPNSKATPASQALAVKRLARRSLGFANALEAVNQAIHDIDREQLVAAQGDTLSMVGSLSVESMHLYHQQLSDSMAHWVYHNIAGTDHSLPYQKPRQISRIFNEHVQ